MVLCVIILFSHISNLVIKPYSFFFSKRILFKDVALEFQQVERLHSSNMLVKIEKQIYIVSKSLFLIGIIVIIIPFISRKTYALFTYPDFNLKRTV